MSTISAGVGLFSGIDIAGLVDALITAQSGTVRRLEARSTAFEAERVAIQSLESSLLSVSTSVRTLGESATFQTFQVDVSNDSILNVTANANASPGDYQFQAIQRAASHQVLSKGFANSDQQGVGSGTLSIGTTGQLQRPTFLDALNGGSGVRRGTIRVTDRSGGTATIDLSTAYSIGDVLDAINGAEGVAVTATTHGGRIILNDSSGSTANDLAVVDLSGGHSAEDLGIQQSVSAATLAGDSVFALTGDFTLDQINDGNDLYRLAGAPDLQVTLSDGTVLDVNLDRAATLNEVLDTINNHAGNNGKLQAALVNGHLELTDLAGGTGAVSIQDANGAAVVRQLGLDVSASNNVLSGRSLLAGINSVLLRNLRGGQGIGQLGQIALTDRTGTMAVVDLAGAESLDDVLFAINTAQSSGGTRLQLTAQIDATGTGLEIRDTSGAASSNLVIADVGSGTVAQDLGIVVNAAQTLINSGSLNHRDVNTATSLADYAPDAGGIAEGSVLIADSAGNQASIQISSSAQTVGDVLLRINAAPNIAVRAELNRTGDGYVLIDQAGGSGTLSVAEIDSTTAADLRILGQATVVNGTSQIASRRATIIQVDAADSLDDIAQKINDAGGAIKATVFDDGSAFNSFRLTLQSKALGHDGRFAVDAGSLNLGLATYVEGRDALLRWGGTGSNGFLIASASNTFQNAAPGLDVEVRNTSDQPVDVTVARNTTSIRDVLDRFVNNYNAFYDSAGELTKFDSETNERGVLQGSGFVLRASSRLESLLGRRLFGPDQTVRSLADLGVTVDKDGRLALDAVQFDRTFQQNFESASNFFLDAKNGFAARMTSTIDSLTDSVTGTLTFEENSLQDSIDTIQKRITDLNALLEMRRARLEREFLAMEQALGVLTDQQSLISSLPSSGLSKTSGKG